MADELDEATLVADLHLPPGTAVSLSPLAAVTSRCCVAEVLTPDGDRSELVLRGYDSIEALEAHARHSLLLFDAGFTHAPKMAGISQGWACERLPRAMAAISVSVGPEEARAVALAAAALHGITPGAGDPVKPAGSQQLVERELPLFRLGFAAGERTRAAGPIREIQTALRARRCSFTHGQLIAANVLLGEGGPWFVDFAASGYGVGLIDLAAFLLSAGLPPEERRRAAEEYAAARGEPREEVADLVDAAGLLWGLWYLIGLPRREVELLGDDASRRWLQLTAERISRGIREPAGVHPGADALRSALWPGRPQADGGGTPS